MSPPARGAFPAAFAAGAGALFAAWLYGAGVIDPHATGWLLHDDSAQHYLGLVYFLNQPWHWPPGLILQFGDDPTSVVFTDSIPLLAFPAKLLGAAGRWQYFGPWILACHALAGWFGARLVQRTGGNPAAAALGGVFFALSPTILLRAYGHESLMGQFLVIAALERALRPEWRARGWVALALVALLVHAYLATMVIALGAASATAGRVRGTVGTARLVASALALAVVLAVPAWLAGYLVGAGDVVALGYGHFTANLLTWVDPMDWAAFNRFWGRDVPYAGEWSRWVPSVGQATVGQYEGFAYLGLGMIAVVAVATLSLATRARVEARDAGAVPAASWAWVLAACLAMLALAVSNKPTFGVHHLPDIPLPAAADRLLGAFRAGGRFVWPLTFVLMGWALGRVGRLRAGAVVIAVALAVQVADLSGKLAEFHARFRQPSADAALRETVPQWNALLRRCPDVRMVSKVHPGEGWVTAAIAAGESGARFHPAPTARFSQELERQRLKDVQDLLERRDWRPGTLYLLAPPLPDGFTAAGILASLPPNMASARIGSSDVVFDAKCRDGR